jgi:predicted O-linked N-acetylglucosamine transferase (SPINDLY family)
MLQGRMYASRFGGSVLANVGLDDLIAHSVEEYVERAVGLAGDLDRLAELRAQLRPRMAASALLDFQGFARNVEAAYRQMWVDWCATSQAQGR